MSSNATNTTTTTSSTTAAVFSYSIPPDRLATLFFFGFALFEVCRQFLAMEKRAFVGRYNITRTLAMFFVMLHTTTAISVSLLLAAGGKRVNGGVLFTSCISTLIYQELVVHMLYVKMNAVTTGKFRVIVKAVSYTCIAVRACLSIAAFGIFIHLFYYAPFNAAWLPLKNTAVIVNGAANVVYVSFVVGSQLYFLYVLHKNNYSLASATNNHAASNTSTSFQQTNQTSSMTKNVRKSLKFRDMTQIGIIAIGAITVMLCSFFVVHHSLGIAMITFSTAFLLNLYQSQDIQAIGMTTASRAAHTASLTKPQNTSFNKGNSSFLKATTSKRNDTSNV